jgi:hypothetical protein
MREGPQMRGLRAAAALRRRVHERPREAFWKRMDHPVLFKSASKCRSPSQSHRGFGAARGQFCARRHKRDYKRYGLSCSYVRTCVR